MHWLAEVTCVRLNEHMNMFQGSLYVPTVDTTSSIRFYVCFLSYPNRLSEQSILGQKGSNGEKVWMRRAERGTLGYSVYTGLT
jgi:hypothetical protein